MRVHESRQHRAQRRTLASSTNASMRVFQVLLATRSRTGRASALSAGSTGGASGAISSADMHARRWRFAGTQRARSPLEPGTWCRLAARASPVRVLVAPGSLAAAADVPHPHPAPDCAAPDAVLNHIQNDVL